MENEIQSSDPSFGLPQKSTSSFLDLGIMKGAHCKDLLSKFTALPILAATSLLLSGYSFGASEAIPSISGGIGVSGSYMVGWKFSTDEDISLSKLGYLDANGDGVLNGGAKQVGVWNSDGSQLLVSGTIPANVTADANDMFYVDVSDTVLPAGDYVIAAVANAGGEPYLYDTAIESSQNIEWIEGRFNIGSSFAFPTYVRPEASSYMGPNFVYEPVADHAMTSISSVVQSGSGDSMQGYRFSTEAISLTKLGYFDVNEDGVLNGGSKQVGVWNSDGSELLVSGTIPANATADSNNIFYVDVTATDLPAGEYVIGAVMNAGGEQYKYNGAAPTTSKRIQWIEGLSNASPTFAFPASPWPGMVSTLGATFAFTPQPTEEAITSVSGGIGAGGDYVVGWKFSAVNDIVMTHLGYMDVSNDGYINGPAKQVGIWNSDGSELLVSGTIPAGAAADANNMFYVDVTDTVLPAGDYVIAAEATAGGEPYLYNTTITSSPDIEWIEGRFNIGSSFAFPTYVRPEASSYVGPNFKFMSLALELTGPTVSRAVYQQDSSGSADVLVQTKTSGFDIPLEYQVVDHNTTNVIMSWSSFTNGNHGFADVTLPLPAGWYDIQVRSTDSTYSTDFTINRVGVGEVFAVAGQSNSANYGTHPASGPREANDDRVSMFNLTTDQWLKSKDPQPNATTGAGGSAWTYLGDYLTSCLDLPIHILPVGQGSTQVQQWEWSLYGSRFQGSGAQEHLNTYGGVRAFLWHQGESDAIAATSAISYQNTLETLISWSRVNLNDAALPWFVALASFHPWTTAVTEAPIIEGQQSTINNDSNVYVGSETDGFAVHDVAYPSEEPLLHDGVHFSAHGLDEHAKKWFNALRNSGVVPGMSGCSALSQGYSE